MKKILVTVTLVIGLTTPIAHSQPYFAGCGTLVPGVEGGCIIFQSDGGIPFLLLLEDYGGFDIGDTVLVAGQLNPWCITICMQGICLEANSISRCYPCCLERGNIDRIGQVNILDLTFLVDHAFRNGERPPCDEEADINSDGIPANILDLTFLVDFFFRHGPAPAPCN